MIYDMHVHITQVNRYPATDHFLTDKSNRYVRMFLRHLDIPPNLLRHPQANELICRKIAGWIAASSIDRAVILAMDGAYDLDGRFDAQRTYWMTDNDFVANLAEQYPSILFGASLHPYRVDAMKELSRVAARGACLMKWIPSAQRIQLDHPRCIPFYELLAEYRIPLLVHTGNEHASSRSLNDWNDPALLRHALDRGVTVIAAHCGARMFLHERNRFKTFCQIAMEYENCFGDLAAFGIPTRLGPLKTLQKNEVLLSKIVYGSDLPAFVMPRWFFFSIGRKAVREILQETNPLEKPYRLMKALGMPDEIFSRVEKLLPLKAKPGENP
jgi:predicted TIM-barrel fold metal-dependent hydrolase